MKRTITWCGRDHEIRIAANRRSGTNGPDHFKGLHSAESQSPQIQQRTPLAIRKDFLNCFALPLTNPSPTSTAFDLNKALRKLCHPGHHSTTTTHHPGLNHS